MQLVWVVAVDGRASYTGRDTTGLPDDEEDYEWPVLGVFSSLEDAIESVRLSHIAIEPISVSKQDWMGVVRLYDANGAFCASIKQFAVFDRPIANL